VRVHRYKMTKQSGNHCNALPPTLYASPRPPPAADPPALDRARSPSRRRPHTRYPRRRRRLRHPRSQRLTLAHLSAQRKRCLWDKGCLGGTYEGVQEYLWGFLGVALSDKSDLG
jgi:hypothetical protein